MVARTISHYEILEKIGSGGMGVVYKAKDTKLNRLVAVKFLPSHLTDDATSKKRFIREAQTASALDHPNIYTVHEIGESEEGQLFLVMAYYDGEPLSAKIRRGPLTLDVATCITRQLLEGLAVAHKAGVVHRDIKPSNIVVTAGTQVKILDFGLAQLSGQAEALTETGVAPGTLLYMSPEQLSGSSVDLRSDLWAVGTVLYEMLTARTPFENVHAIMRKEAKSVAMVRSDVPTTIDKVLHKALSKDRTQRYQNAQEFAYGLSSLACSPSVASTASVTSPEEQSILVLPFVNLNPNKRGDYFSDGLTDEIITDLTNVRTLRVICRTSAMRLKEVTGDLRKLADDLGVQHILEGTVQKVGDSLRVTAKLINPANDSLIWAAKYSGGFEDVFTIQQELSHKIVDALKVKLTSKEEEKLEETPITNLRAYECYLKARHEILSYSKESLERALRYLESGLQIVGPNVLLTSAIGHVHWQFVNAGISSDPAHLENAYECALQILAREPDSSHGLRLMGLIQVTRGNAQEGIVYLKRALDSQPSDPDTLSWLIAVYGFSGKPYAAAPIAKRLLEIDPLTPSYQCLPGLIALMAGEFGRAVAPFEKSLEMEPDNAMLRFSYAHVLALNNRFDDSVRVIDTLEGEAPHDFFSRLGQFYKHALMVEKQRAAECVTAELMNIASADPHYCWNMCECYALLDDKSAALDWLARAVSRGFINYPLLARLDPFLENIRKEATFEAIMNETRDRWERFEV